MKRRLEIARGLLHHPKLLFLDEPTIGLDPQTRAHMWQYIMELKESEGISIFMTTHYMDEAEYCDRVAIIDHGRIVVLDTPAALKQEVGGDVIRLKTGDDTAAIEEISRRCGLQAIKAEDGILFHVNNGEVVHRNTDCFPAEIGPGLPNDCTAHDIPHAVPFRGLFPA